MDVGELYGLPLERFVPERTALVRELRAAGQRDEAAAVASLRKPSVPARAVNQLAREHRHELRQLFAAGDALSEVQSSVLAGRAGGRDLSEARARERDAVSTLVDTASALLVAEGLTPSASVLERISETLHAAALDDAARQPVDEGRLERELRHVGLGMGAGADVATPPKREPRKSKASGETDARKQAEAQERAEAKKRAQARTQADATEKAAGRQAARAAKDLDDAERAHARASEALEQAKETLAAARRAAKAAETAHRKAERELRRLES